MYLKSFLVEDRDPLCCICNTVTLDALALRGIQKMPLKFRLSFPRHLWFKGGLVESQLDHLPGRPEATSGGRILSILGILPTPPSPQEGPHTTNSTESRESSWCQLRRHWLHRKLSFHTVKNSTENQFCCNSSWESLITTSFCTCHDSTDVVPCAKFDRWNK